MAGDVTGSVMKNDAHFPGVMLPMFSDNPIAYAPLIVAAAMASSGSIPIYKQASESTNAMLPEGEEPGLKSEASAIGNPASIILRAGA